MKYQCFVTAVCLLAAASLPAQQIALPANLATDTAVLARAMPTLAREVLARFAADDRDTYLNTTFRLQMVAGQYTDAIATLAQLRALRRPADTTYAPIEYSQYEIYARAKLLESSLAHDDAVKRAFAEVYVPLNDKLAYRVSGSFDFNPRVARDDLKRSLEQVHDSISLRDAVALLRRYHVYEAYRSILPIVPALVSAENARRYVIDENVSIRTRDGAVVSAIVVRPRASAKQPALLSFTIYAQPLSLSIATQSAASGYVGVVANTRGKRNSPGPVTPYEHDGNDAYDVIDWISRQPWSNGKVGMFGGSYEGFTQWASMKHRVHPALKTIVPSAAVVPGFDTPTENGIFQSFQYAWIPYVTNVKLLDDATYNDRARWNRLDSTWFASGRSYRSLDSIDGTPSPLFHRVLDHPTYDAYWQSLTPQGKEFAHIDIPVLTTTGYFDGAQRGALHYLTEHLAHKKKADHYLLIGPWEHFGSQGRPLPTIAGYQTDPASRLDITGIIYQWMDYVMKGGPKPAILADRINYQVMGTNGWRHAPSLEKMSNDTMTLYLSNARSGDRYQLRAQHGTDADVIPQRVDLAARTVTNDNSIHDPLSSTTLDVGNGLAFVSEPLAKAVTISGSFVGTLRASINKRDIDVGVQLYELTPDSQYFQLSFFVGRASLAKDRTRRQLLRPGAVESIPFAETRMISRVLGVGSRLVVVVNVNTSAQSPINYGTGKDVNAESIADAGVPLKIEWRGSSKVKVPIWR